ncbi:MAG: carboxylating nicotinate-nucleotide diphosphorylase [Clostridiales bacterium]|nr:carboxylating nicotinate-nucleotide diphosphorylase [Clostridiales bacterium]
MTLNPFYIDELIKNAISEDVNYIDVSGAFTVPAGRRDDAYLVAKGDGVLCGIDVFTRVFELLDPTFTCDKKFADGDSYKKGDVIIEMNGVTTELLRGERTALNILQHMSGIATQTALAVKAVKGTGACVCETRKTLPGLRAIEKYAVLCGGGRNHRYNLSDCVMLKDNHIDACGGILPAVAALREKLGHTVKIECETRCMDEVRDALEAGADIIMLDNMTPQQMAEAVAEINGRAVTEASGNVTLDNIASVAACGVDIISMGSLTHSAKAADISMKIRTNET